MPRNKSISKIFLIIFFVSSFYLASSIKLFAEPVSFKVVLINPSKTKTQKAMIKKELPVEVKPSSVIDLAGLELEYDTKQSIYYLYKEEVELLPNEVRVYEILVEDIWQIKEEEIKGFEERVENLLIELRDTNYYFKAQEISNEIYSIFQDINRTQSDETLSRERHIGAYRENVELMNEVKDKVAEMEKILVTAGGPPAPSMLEDTKVTSDSPSKNMTWIIIFIIIIFIGLLAAVLFFTWQQQARITRDVLSASRKSAFPGEYDNKTSEKE